MTDGTQELDEIVREFIRSAYQKPESTFLNAIYYQKFKKELLDWHNKRELEAMIDSLEYAKISPKFKIEEKIEQLRLELNKYE